MTYDMKEYNKRRCIMSNKTFNEKDLKNIKVYLAKMLEPGNNEADSARRFLNSTLKNNGVPIAFVDTDLANPAVRKVLERYAEDPDLFFGEGDLAGNKELEDSLETARQQAEEWEQTAREYAKAYEAAAKRCDALADQLERAQEKRAENGLGPRPRQETSRSRATGGGSSAGAPYQQRPAYTPPRSGSGRSMIAPLLLSSFFLAVVGPLWYKDHAERVQTEQADKEAGAVRASAWRAAAKNDVPALKEALSSQMMRYSTRDCDGDRIDEGRYGAKGCTMRKLLEISIDAKSWDTAKLITANTPVKWSAWIMGHALGVVAEAQDENLLKDLCATERQEAKDLALYFRVVYGKWDAASQLMKKCGANLVEWGGWRPDETIASASENGAPAGFMKELKQANQRALASDELKADLETAARNGDGNRVEGLCSQASQETKDKALDTLLDKHTWKGASLLLKCGATPGTVNYSFKSIVNDVQESISPSSSDVPLVEELERAWERHQNKASESVPQKLSQSPALKGLALS
jgi:hypothetical protein